MQLILQKNRICTTLILLLIATSFFFACQKQVTGGGIDVVVVPVVLPDLSTKINSSVSGFVTDENDAAVINATVTAGTSTASTDKYGYFEITNVSVVKVAAIVTVSRPGYFKGIKTYVATANKSAFLRVKLLPKIIAGNIAAGTGGTVTLANGLSVLIPANAIVNNATGIAYTGTVNIAAYCISPASAELIKIMPGDLRGIDTVGAIKILTTYGMAAVELTGAAGELLQIAPNKKATLTFPIPLTIISKAPATIPLWYFNEANGLWKQQGSATKTGNNYVGEVSHFSFWSSDVPANYVQFSCTVVDVNGNAIPNAVVKISAARDTQTIGCRYGYTDTLGFVAGAIPGNAQLAIEVLGENSCPGALYTQTFASTTADVALGKVTIISGNTTIVTGNVTNCSNVAVTNGYIMLNTNGQNYRYPLSSTGAFSFSTLFCSSNPTVSIFAVDMDGLQQNTPVTITLATGTNAAGTLTTCGTLIQQFVNYTINGVAYSIATPGDNLIHNFYKDDYLYAHQTGPGRTASVNIDFTHTGIAKNSVQALQYLAINNIKDSVTITAPIAVNITEYGAINQFIAGNFTGSLTGASPANKQYAITCSFRVMRSQ